MKNNIELPKMNNNDNKALNNLNQNKDGIKEVIKYITTRNSKDLLALILRLLLIVIIIFICKFPFDLLKDVGINLLILIGISINDSLLNIWTAIINIIYGILGIYAFIKLVKIRFKNINN